MQVRGVSRSGSFAALAKGITLTFELRLDLKLS
jgi:hypothetical protein